MVMDVQQHFEQYFCDIMAFSFIDGLLRPNLSHITDKLYHIKLYLLHVRIKLTTLMVIGRCKYNYNMISHHDDPQKIIKITCN